MADHKGIGGGWVVKLGGILIIWNWGKADNVGDKEITQSEGSDS